MRKKKLILVVVCLLQKFSYCQQEIAFTQFNFTNQLFNPSYVGTENQSNAFILNRAQWIDIEGAPKSQAYGLNSYIENYNLGWGVELLNDQIGPLEQITASFDLSYHLKLNRKDHFLSLGLKISSTNFNFNNNELSIIDNGDTFFERSDYSQLQTNIGFGVLYRRPQFYIGLSIPFFLASDQFETVKHTYLSAGGEIELNNEWTIKPYNLFKYVKGAPLNYNLNLLLFFEDIFWIGPSSSGILINSDNASIQAPTSGLMVGLAINSYFSFGYSYTSITRIDGKIFSNINSSTHEFYLSYKFKSKSNRKEKKIGLKDKGTQIE